MKESADVSDCFELFSRPDSLSLERYNARIGLTK